MTPRPRVISSRAGASPSAPAISVVIPTHRPAERLAPTLDALAQQTLGADRFEVIVVLDGPDRGRAEALRDATHRFRFEVLLSPGVGRAAACNTGVAAAHGDIVLLLDDDMALAADALAAHVARHARGRRLGVIGAAPVRVLPGAPFAARFVARRFGRHLAKLGRPGYAIDVRDVYMGAFSIERAAFVAVGGFDDGFIEYGNEDGDLAGRLLAAGVELVYAPEAIAHQDYDKSFADLANDHVAKGRTALRFLRLHPERSAESPLHRRGRGSWRRRLVRPALQRIIAFPHARQTLLAATERAAGTIERLHPALADRLAAAVLDAFFWSGVQAAIREAATHTDGRRTVVHYTDAETMGGAERIALTLLTGLDRSRWRPVLVAHANPGIVAMLDEARAARIEVRVVALMRGPGGLLAVPALARTFRRLRPDIIHVHRSWAQSGNVGVVAAILSGSAARVATEHLYLPTTPRRAIWVRRTLDRFMDRTVAVSAAIGEVLADRFHAPPDRLAVIRNGIAPPQAPDPSAVRTLRRELLAGRDGKIALVVAQLVLQKGHATLIGAMRDVPDVVAVFAGSGPERDHLVHEAAAAGVTDRVRFLGHRADIPALMEAADVVVLPSLAEGLPLAIMEAFALGRPVVASSVGGVPELIEDGVTGRLVGAGDASGLADSMRGVLDDPTAAARLGSAAADRYASSFTAERMVAETEALYDGLRGEHARPGPAGSEVVSRTLDWRFLVGGDRYERIATFGPAVDGLASITDEVVDGRTAPRGTADVGFATLGDGATLARLYDVLRPDGTAVVRLDRLGGVDRNIVHAGFARARVVAPWPSAERALAWIPLDDPVARARLLGRARPGPRARLGAWRRGLWALRRERGLGGPVFVIANRSTDAPTPVDRAAWADAHGDQLPGPLTWALLTGGRESVSKAVAIGTRRGSREPGIVVKWPRTVTGGLGLANEVESLRHLATARPGLVERIPVIIKERTTANGPAVVETLVPGVPLARVLSRERHASLAIDAADWLAELALDHAFEERDAWWPVTAAPIVERFERLVSPAVTSDRLAASRERLEVLGRLPTVFEHRDFAPWNLLVDKDGTLRAVDWESSVQCGLPLLDLWYFLTYLALAVERVPERRLADVYPQLVDPSSRTGRVTALAVDRYLQRVGLDPAAVSALRGLTWMVHTPSELERRPPDADPSSTMFVRLWAYEMST